MWNRFVLDEHRLVEDTVKIRTIDNRRKSVPRCLQVYERRLDRV